MKLVSIASFLSLVFSDPSITLCSLCSVEPICSEETSLPVFPFPHAVRGNVSKTVRTTITPNDQAFHVSLEFFVLEQLDKGLMDFGVIFGPVDHSKYHSIKIPHKDIWGVLMRRDSPLAEKESVVPEDLRDQPIILSQQEGDDGLFTAWMGKKLSELEIIATYNLLFNASLMVSEGLGYAVGLDKIINTAGSSLCFRPLFPVIESDMSLIWKKYQIFSKAAERFLTEIKGLSKTAP